MVICENHQDPCGLDDICAACERDRLAREYAEVVPQLHKQIEEADREVERLTSERDKWRLARDEWHSACLAERERANLAERERDEARKALEGGGDKRLLALWALQEVGLVASAHSGLKSALEELHHRRALAEKVVEAAMRIYGLCLGNEQGVRDRASMIAVESQRLLETLAAWREEQTLIVMDGADIVHQPGCRKLESWELGCTCDETKPSDKRGAIARAEEKAAQWLDAAHVVTRERDEARERIPYPYCPECKSEIKCVDEDGLCSMCGVTPIAPTATHLALAEKLAEFDCGHEIGVECRCPHAQALAAYRKAKDE